MPISYFLGVHYFQSLTYVNTKSRTRHGRPCWWWNRQWLHLFLNHPNESWSVGLWLLENRKQSQAWPYLKFYVTARSPFQWQEMCWAKNILSRCKSGRCDCNTPRLAIYSPSSISQCTDATSLGNHTSLRKRFVCECTSACPGGDLVENTAR